MSKFRAGDIVTVRGKVKYVGDYGISIEFANFTDTLLKDEDGIEFVSRTFAINELVRFSGPDRRPYRVVQNVGDWVVIDPAKELWDTPPIPDKPVIADPRDLVLHENVVEAFEPPPKPAVPRFHGGCDPVEPPPPPEEPL